MAWGYCLSKRLVNAANNLACLEKALPWRYSLYFHSSLPLLLFRLFHCLPDYLHFWINICYCFSCELRFEKLLRSLKSPVARFLTKIWHWSAPLSTVLVNSKSTFRNKGEDLCLYSQSQVGPLTALFGVGMLFEWYWVTTSKGGGMPANHPPSCTPVSRIKCLSERRNYY